MSVGYDKENEKLILSVLDQTFGTDIMASTLANGRKL